MQETSKSGAEMSWYAASLIFRVQGSEGKTGVSLFGRTYYLLESHRRKMPGKGGRARAGRAVTIDP